MAFLKSVFVAASCGLAASLSAGDCAFVGIYGDQDDFALVLMEDANGETISLTEGLPSEKHFKVGKYVEAKQHVSGAKRGSVLKKADFQTGSTQLVAPLALTAFKGSAESPEVLCSINLDGQAGAAKEENTVMLGNTETAEYAGSTSGSKEELLAGITNPQNWLRNGAARKLQGFSIAKGNETTTTMTTMMNTTMGMTTTMMETTMMETTTTVAVAVKVPGCIGFTADAAIPEGANAAFAEAIAATAGASVTADMIKDVVVTTGGCARRLASMDRRLQTAYSVSYVIEFPATLANAAEVAAAAKTAIESITPAELTTTITQKMEDAGITGITVTATSITVSEPEVLIDDEEPPTSKAAFAGAAGSLLAILSMM